MDMLVTFRMRQDNVMTYHGMLYVEVYAGLLRINANLDRIVHRSVSLSGYVLCELAD